LVVVVVVCLSIFCPSVVSVYQNCKMMLVVVFLYPSLLSLPLHNARTPFPSLGWRVLLFQMRHVNNTIRRGHAAEHPESGCPIKDARGWDDHVGGRGKELGGLGTGTIDHRETLGGGRRRGSCRSAVVSVALVLSP
jgi:hypothetical protein